MANGNNNTKFTGDSNTSTKSQNRKRGSKSSKGNRGNQRRNKEFEVNVKDNSVNKEDLPHVMTSTASGNDYGWYKNIGALFEDVANINFSYPIGSGIKPLRPGSGAFTVAADNTTGAVPGVMTFTIAPTIGVCQSATDAANIAANQVFTTVRKANSKSLPYDRTDVMMLVLAMDSAYMLYEELLRAYRIIGSYDYMSRYMPYGLLESLGFSEELVKDYRNFKGVLDLFAYQLGSIVIPNVFDFIKRHSWLFTNVYADSEAATAQLYAYKPDGFYVWTEGTESKATYLKYTTRTALYGLTGTSVVSSLDQVQTAIDTIMQPILGSGDISNISPDIAKAFEGNVITIAVPQEHEMLKPAYNMEVIRQMCNCMSTTSVVNNNDVTADNTNLVTGPILKCQPTMNVSTQMELLGLIRPLLNLDVKPNPDDTMVATRLTYVPGSTSFGQFDSVGTEIVTTIQVWTRNMSTVTGNAVSDQLLVNTIPSALGMIVDGQPNTEAPIILSLLSNFDWHPTVYLFSYNGEDSEASYHGYVCDTNYYTFLDDKDIKQLNEVAVMSLFSSSNFESVR